MHRFALFSFYKLIIFQRAGSWFISFTAVSRHPGKKPVDPTWNLNYEPSRNKCNQSRLITSSWKDGESAISLHLSIRNMQKSGLVRNPREAVY